MSDLKIKIGCSHYDHTRALFDGMVKIDGVDASFESADIVSEIFERMLRQRAFDVLELGLTFYLRTLDFEDPPFMALPVFPNHQFGSPHSSTRTAACSRSIGDHTALKRIASRSTPTYVTASSKASRSSG